MDEQKLRYLKVKVATDRFQLNLEYLTAEQRKEVAIAAENILSMQNTILHASEAQRVEVTSAEVLAAYQKCVDNFEDKQRFYAALKNQGLTQDGYKMALREELLCDKVLELVSQDIPKLNHQHALEYYNKNRLDFSRSTTWQVKQILITVNDDFEENTRTNALKRIHALYQLAQTESFGELAIKHSECPSAVEHGDLGWCEEGKLFTELSEALHKLSPGEVSQPIETEVGFHLIQWTEKKAPYTASFEEALPFLEEKHTARAKAFVQKEWLSQLVS
jgi:nitrogen fixation protein NifM